MKTEKEVKEYLELTETFITHLLATIASTDNANIQRHSRSVLQTKCDIRTTLNWVLGNCPIEKYFNEIK